VSIANFQEQIQLKKNFHKGLSDHCIIEVSDDGTRICSCGDKLATKKEWRDHKSAINRRLREMKRQKTDEPLVFANSEDQNMEEMNDKSKSEVEVMNEELLESSQTDTPVGSQSDSHNKKSQAKFCTKLGGLVFWYKLRTKFGTN